jgi:hypothetical protein
MNQPCTCPQQVKHMGELCPTCLADYGTYLMWLRALEPGRLDYEAELIARAQRQAEAGEAA